MKHNPSFLLLPFCLSALLPFCLSALLPFSLSASTTYFVADETTNFCNPERGFYIHSEQKVTSEGQTNLSQSTFAGARKSGNSLLLRLYYFDNFRTKELPQAVLDQISSDFELFRQNGCKAVLRFAYTNDNDNYPIKDASPEIWERHLEQLKPILHDNADAIAVVQAGFLGAWGEWYFSSTGTGAGIKQSIKNDLINELLDAVPASRAVQLRTPDYKRDYLGVKEALPESEAFSGTPRARLGHHNDAFLYQSDNMGTYSNRTVDMNYLNQECLYLPNGGETDVCDESVYKKWATGEQAQAEMAQLHYSYLNQGYCSTTLDHWRKDGSFDILARHMGYRFQLVEATLPDVQRPNETMPVKLTIKNVGYATPYNERHAYFVLIGEEKTYTFPLQSDPRFWAPNNGLTIVEENITLPTDIAEGIYQTALWLPDAGERIAKDSRFAIRLANVNLWDDETGYNKLGMPIHVSATAPQPQPDPEPEPTESVRPVTQLNGSAGKNSVTLQWLNPVTPFVYDTIRIDMATGHDTTSVNMKAGDAEASVTYKNGVSTVSYTTHTDWLWAGVNYPVDGLPEDASVSFECKGDGSSLDMLAYAHDGQVLWRGSGFAVSLASTSWEQYTYTPIEALWVDPGYLYGEKKIRDIGFIANPSGSKTGSFELRNIMINTKHEVKSDFEAVRIIRNADRFPESISDGTLVYYGNGTHCVDGDLEFGHTYYYAAYAENKEGEIAFPATLSITVDGTALPQVKPYSSTPLLPYTKILRNGQIFIERNGVRYNVLGTRF